MVRRLGLLSGLVGLLLPLSLAGAPTASACTGCWIHGAEMVAQATTIELVRYVGPAGRDMDGSPLATFREVALLEGRPIASVRLATWPLSKGYRHDRLLLLRVPNWGDITLLVSRSGAVEPWDGGEGNPGPYPLTLAGWRALIASAPDTATAPGAQRRSAGPGGPVLLAAAAGLGAVLAFRRKPSPTRRRAS